ncbi:MAG: glycosyltransferase [Desulfarculaceae bacterium]|nr:glycosyltransferase [Desulfarculaceae bacterium]MCF8072923.1 glycosyltransferase [Desulfarculaceae bacterium]MCF8101091.1 glycosyltransferase [Desulfarculaceae bacterium]MCF8115522.1 glycosyltransferase [Desulfarculaceae bacterium]
MRLVYLSDTLLPSRMANSVHVMKMCAAFAGLGHEVTLIAVDNRASEPGVDNLFAHYGVAPNFRLITLPFPRFKGGWTIYAWRSARLALGLGPEVLFGRYLRGLYLCSLMGARPALESHVPPSMLDRLSRAMFRCMERRKALRLLVVISSALERLVRAQSRVEPILVAHDGADLPPEDQAAEPLEGEFPVGYFGNLYPGRGIELILETARLTPWASFHLVGGQDPELLSRLRDQAPGNVALHGFVPPARAMAMQRGCRALLMPYQQKVNVPGLGDTSQWMSPLKMFEYMASGAAIVSSDLPVLGEVLADGDNALLVPPAEPEAWAHALTRLRGEPGLAQGLAQRARNDLAEHYTWTRRAQAVLEALASKTARP